MVVINYVTVLFSVLTRNSDVINLALILGNSAMIFEDFMALT